MGTLGRLTADQLDLALDTFDFEQTLSDTLGDLGTPADGFESYVNDTIILLSAVGDPGSSLDNDLNLAAGVGSSIDPLSLQGDATSLPASLAVGNSILADANALAGSVGSAPTPGGGGSGGGASACGSLAWGAVPVSGPTGSTTVKQTIGLQNNTRKRLTIKSTSWSPNLGFTFVVDPPIVNAAIDPGATMPITIDFTPGTVGSYSSTLAITTDGPDPQPCLTVSGSGFPGQGPHPPNPRCPTGDLVNTGHVKITPHCA